MWPTTNKVRRLRDFQFVSLSAGDGTTGGRVVAVGGEEAVLTADRPALVAALSLPSRALLSFETARHPVMLSGLVDEGPIEDTVRFVVTDDVGVRQWRLSPRLIVPCDVEVGSASGQEDAVMAERLQTVDLSAGGAFVAGLGGDAGDRYAIRLHVPGLTGPACCTAQVVRGTPRGAALTFVDLDPDVAETIEQIIYAVRVRLARRAGQPRPGRASGAGTDQRPRTA